MNRNGDTKKKARDEARATLDVGTAHNASDRFWCIAEYVKRSTNDQSVPEKISDPETITKLAGLVAARRS